MELSYIASAAKRFWWLVLLGAVIGGALGYAASLNRSTTYSASAQLIVRPAASGPLEEASGNRYPDNQALVVTSAEIADDVAEATGESPERALRGVRAEPVNQADAIEITATRPDPDAAIVVANAFADAYVEKRKADNDRAIDLALEPLQERETELLAELVEVQEEIISWGAELTRLFEAESPTSFAQTQLQQAIGEQTQISNELAAVEAQIAELETARLTAIRDQVVRPATSATESASRSTLVATAGVLVGAVMGVVAAIFLSMTSGIVVDTLHAEELLGAPVIGALRRRRSLKALASVLEDRRASANAVVDELCVRIETAPTSGPPLTVAVVGTMVGAGASTVAAAIAARCADRGHRTLLADGDVRDPSISVQYLPGSRHGLSELLTTPDQLVPSRDLASVRRNLDVVGLGQVELRPPTRQPGQPSFGSLAAHGHEIVVIDCGALLLTSSSVALARSVDVVVVVSPSRRERVGNLSSIHSVLDSVHGVVLAVTNLARSGLLPSVGAMRSGPQGVVAYRPEPIETPFQEELRSGPRPIGPTSRWGRRSAGEDDGDLATDVDSLAGGSRDDEDGGIGRSAV